MIDLDALAAGILDGSVNETNLRAHIKGEEGFRLAVLKYILDLTQTAADAEEAALNSIPVGAVLSFATLMVPDGWLFCDGSEVSRTTYANLFEALGGAGSPVFGPGDGSTTFNLPDLRGRYVAGRSDAAGTVLTDRLTSDPQGFNNNTQNLGATGGAESIVLSENELPQHHHTLDWSATGVADSNGGGSTISVITPGGSTNTSDVGIAEAHSNVPPTILLNYFIKY